MSEQAKTEIEVSAMRLEETKLLRAEMNWRLQTAYNSPIYYVSGLLILTAMSARGASSGTIDTSLLAVLAFVFALTNAMYVGILSANQYSLKRAELYLLRVQREANRGTSSPALAWQSYVHVGEPDWSKPVRVVSLVSHSAIAVFQFFIPLALSVGAFAVGVTTAQWSVGLLALAVVSGGAVCLAALVAGFVGWLSDLSRRQHALYYHGLWNKVEELSK